MIYSNQKLSLLDWIVLVGIASYYVLPSVSVKVGILQIIFISIAYILISRQFKVFKEVLRYFAILCLSVYYMLYLWMLLILVALHRIYF